MRRLSSDILSLFYAHMGVGEFQTTMRPAFMIVQIGQGVLILVSISNSM